MTIILKDGKIESSYKEMRVVSTKKSLEIFFKKSAFLKVLFFPSLDCKISFYVPKNVKISLFFQFMNAKKDFFLKNTFLFFLEKEAFVEINYFLKHFPKAKVKNFLEGNLKEKSCFYLNLFSKGFLKEIHDMKFFLQKESSLKINHLSFLKNKSSFFGKFFVKHLEKNTTSDILCKSIVEKGTSFFYEGMVQIDNKAIFSKSSQMNKNLVLGDALVKSRPQLDVHIDEVSATHGSAIYFLDEKELFFLRSRGLSKKIIKTLKIKGFCMEMIDLIKARSVREFLQKRFFL